MGGRLLQLDGVGGSEGGAGSEGVDPVAVFVFACKVGTVTAAIPWFDAEEWSIAFWR